MLNEFYKKLEKLIKQDPRYKADAYEFVMQALWFTQKKLNRKDHVSGQELLEGIRELGLEQFGPMTKSVFQHWGVESTVDFGEIVFNMVDNGLMKKTETDKIEDFKNIYDFNKVLDIFHKRKYRLNFQDKKDEDKDLLSSH